jgi:uncharacterized membrane protein
MLGRLLKLWDALRSSYWFVPALMAAGAVVLAFGMVAVDHRVTESVVEEIGWFYTGGADGARAMLSTIASSVITVAGVVFSITIAALTLASSQFGPRLLRNFMRDLGNQLVLGTFVATYLYCLLVLRTVRGTDGSDFVPNLSVTVAVLLASASLGVLIYFIHHIARSMQASQVIAAVSADLHDGIDSLFPAELGRDHGGDERRPVDGLPHDSDTGGQAINAGRDGYLQFIYDDTLMDLAREHDLVVRLLRRPGDYVVRGSALARVWPGGRADAKLCRQLSETMSLGSERTPLQDVQFAVDQLTEVALRAMSPGINDPFTAIACIDRLGSALARLGTRRMPSAYRSDDEGRVRVIAAPVGFEEVLDRAVGPISDHARDMASPQVVDRLRQTLLTVADLTSEPGRRAALLRHAAAAVPEGDDGTLPHRIGGRTPKAS